MYCKLFTSIVFDRATFVNVLRESLGVAAKAVEGGILIDRDKLNSISPAYMPQWVAMNMHDINSPLHTRPATEEEIKYLMDDGRYQLRLYQQACTYSANSDNFVELKRKAINMRATTKGTFYIIDSMTGELIYELEEL